VGVVAAKMADLATLHPTGLINRHATSLVYQKAGATSVGLLIEGPSKSGKSRLALDLITYAQQQDDQAFLIADDQTFIEFRSGQLIAHCPPSIAGLIEDRGVGILNVAHVSTGSIDCMISLVPPMDVKKPASIEICGMIIPLIYAPASQADDALVIALSIVRQYAGEGEERR
jgi:serine kinase of HPr protein (carbohydrate metabolism regulator)